MSEPRILITGSTGFIGMHTYGILKDMGYDATPCSRSSDMFFDLFNDNSIRHIILRTQPTHLLHIAWDVSDGYLENNATNKHCAEQSMKLVREFVKGGGKRIVLAGTQNTPEINRTVYGFWKNELHSDIAHYCKPNGVSYAHGRIYNVYGIYEKRKRLVPTIINNLLDSAPIRLLDKSIDLLNSEDVASALCHITVSDIIGNVDIGSGVSTHLKEIENVVRGCMGMEPKVFPATIERGYTADISRLKKIGWKPKYSLKEGMLKTCDWWKQKRGEP